MEPPYIRTGASEEAEAFGKTPGHWVVGNLRQSIGWTNSPITMEYAGRTFLLLPEDAEHPPAIAALGEYEEARRAILEFASALTWSSGGSVTVEQWSTGRRPQRAGKIPLVRQVGAMIFHVSYLPAPSNQEQRLALALYNEGAGLVYTHVAYAFLSFFKIVNMVSGIRGDAQEAWINAHVPKMQHHRSKERLAELERLGENIGAYVYKSCRCAIAHAGDPRNPVIDPHDLEDERRLHADLPLVITLAELAIEELGVKTRQTVYREHRYELSGFEEMLPAKVLELVQSRGTASDAMQIELPDSFSIRMWGHAAYPPLENMVPAGFGIENGIVRIRCNLKVPGYYADLVLDFPNYRLTAEIIGTPELIDDGSAEFIETTMELERFYWDWNCNGSLEVWAEGKGCIGRCDAFIPQNVILDPKAHHSRVEELKAEIARRPRRTSEC